MSIIAKIRIQHDRLALVPTLQKLDNIQVRVISQGNTAPNATGFPFMVEFADRKVVEKMFDSDPTVDSYELVDWTDQTGIYYIEHTPETEFISNVVTDVNGFLIQTQAEGEGWVARLLLPDRNALNTIWEYASEHEIDFDIIEIYSNKETAGEMSYGLTEEQRIALKLAYKNGYFDEPRVTSLSEVADELDLSSTATSGRLRRGMRNLVSATLVEDENE